MYTKNVSPSDESKIKYGFEDINLWNIIKMSDNTIPRSNCLWKETVHVSRRAYFMKYIILVILTVQRSAVSMEFAFEIRRCLVTHNLLYL